MNENQRTVTLPTIPKEVADAIDLYRKGGASNAQIIECASIRYTSKEAKALRSISVDALLSALVNGYVVEKSAEELAHECIRAEYRYYCEDPYGRGVRHGIIYTLETFGIKIEGVNA